MNNEFLEVLLGLIMTISSMFVLIFVLKYLKKMFISPSELVEDIKNLIKKIVLVAFIIWGIGLILIAYNK